MFRKNLLNAMLFGLLTVGTVSAEVVVRIGPPHAVVERRGVAPGPGYVWINGYHNWDGTRHVWVPGRWDRPPHPGGRWVAHRWVRRGNGWVLAEGHWR